MPLRNYSHTHTLALQANYVTAVEDRPILSAEYSLPLVAQTRVTSPLQCSLSVIAELLVVRGLGLQHDLFDSEEKRLAYVTRVSF